MSYRHTLEAVSESLHEIEDLIAGFPASKGIPDIEVDLALQKLRNIYELLLLLKKNREDPSLHIEDAVAPAAEDAVPSSPAPEVVRATPGKSGKTSEKQILSDQFKGRTTLHESLHQSLAREGESLAQGKPVTDLLTAIGINDRFTFIKELFNNDTAAFENAVNILNDSSSFNDAYNYMIQRFDWDMDSDAVQHLLGIIRRKFIKGRHE